MVTNPLGLQAAAKHTPAGQGVEVDVPLSNQLTCWIQALPAYLLPWHLSLGSRVALASPALMILLRASLTPSPMREENWEGGEEVAEW